MPLAPHHKPDGTNPRLASSPPILKRFDPVVQTGSSGSGTAGLIRSWFRIGMGLGPKGNGGTSSGSVVSAPISSSTPGFIDGLGVAVTAPIVGMRLFPDPGSWSNAPTSYTWQVYDDAGPLPGETGSWLVGDPTPSYVVQDVESTHTLHIGVTATNLGGTSLEAISTATSAVADIDLSADAPVLTRTSASGATPYTVDTALGSKTFASYTVHREIASDSGFGTLLYDGQLVLTETMLQSPLNLDWSQADPVYTEPVHATYPQYYERDRIEAYTPLGVLKTSPWSASIQKTDGLAAMVLSTTDKTANVVISNGSLTFSDGGGGGPNTVRGSRAISPTLSYWEAKPTTATGTLRIGIADGSATITAWWSDGVHDAVYDKGGGLGFNGASNTYATYTTNDVIGFAVDIGASPKLWVAKNNTWQNGTPGVSGGQALTGITTSTLKPAVEGEFGNVVDFHFTSGSFVYTPPSGFTAP